MKNRPWMTQGRQKLTRYHLALCIQHLRRCHCEPLRSQARAEGNRRRRLLARSKAHRRGNLTESAHTSTVCNGTYPGFPTYRKSSSETMFRRICRAHSHLPGLSDRLSRRTLLFLAFAYPCHYSPKGRSLSTHKL